MDSPPSHAWQVLFPPLQAFDGGWLDVGEGHAVHWNMAGHPNAPVALFLHGGPGAGCAPDDRRWFDPQRWRVVLMDQRGCGLSRAPDLRHANTTAHLVADIDRLRLHLGVQRWLLFGGSWGATLALAYAQAHPQHVSALVLRGIFTATRAESCWLYGPRGAALRHPAAWQRLCAAAGVQPGQRLLDAVHDQLQTGSAEAIAAAHAWWHWEHDLMDAETTAPAAPRKPLDDRAALARARIGVHYARAGWFVQEGQLLAHSFRLQGIPGAIVQGTRDLVTPPAAARALHAAWPQAQWHGVPAAGHASTHPGMARQLISATEAFAQNNAGITPQETCDERYGQPQQAS
jgi:proline iminopeptidase